MGTINFKPMRIIVMFDLPNTEKDESKEYRIFHNDLIRNGYFMMQYSIYVKCVNATTKIDFEINKIKKHIPKEGSIRVLTITENQYNSMKIILGEQNLNEVYNNASRYVKV